MTQLTEHQLSTLLKETAPEPSHDTVRAAEARRLAGRMRRRRWMTSGVLVAVIAVATPVAVVVGQSSTDSQPASSVPTKPEHSPVSALNSDCLNGATCDPASVYAAIDRPLHLPSLAPGQACPVSPTRTFTGGAGFTGRFTGIGSGPLYLTPFGRKPSDALLLTAGYGSKQWPGYKVIWVIDRYYGGPLLLRGGRIDKPGELRFERYLGAADYPKSSIPADRPQHSVLYVRGGLGAEGPRVLDSSPSGVFAQSSGCYAIQVDGQGFTETIVFRAAL